MKLRHGFPSTCILFACVAIIAQLGAMGCGEDSPQPEPESRPAAAATVGVSTTDSSTVPPPAVEPPVTVNPNFAQKPKMSGYVTQMCLNVRREPGARAEIVGHLFRGDPINIFEEQRSGGGLWYRMNDAAGYIDGWVSARFISGERVEADFYMPPDYGEAMTPTVVKGITAKYVGVEACKSCHSKAHGEFALGEYGVWRDHFHSSAFQSLSKSYTREFAKKRGVGDPLTDWRCRKCHVTAYGVGSERLASTYRDEDGVGCEVCHGPGGDYLLSHWKGTAGFENREALGFRIFRSLEDRDKHCRSCHNPLSPTYKPFNVEAFSGAIRHWQREYDFNQIAEVLNAQAPASAQVAAVPPKPIPPSVESQAVPVTTRSASSNGSSGNGSVDPAPAAPARGSREIGFAADPNRLVGAPTQVMLNQNGRQRGQVFFPHFKHHKYVQAESEAENCLVCHHTTKPGSRPVACGDCHKVESTADAPNREKAFHGTCRACHQELQRGPRKCAECHNDNA